MLAIFTLQENSALAATRTKADHPAPGLTSLQRSLPGHLRLRAFTLTPAQIGKAVTVTASYTDLGGTAESVTSPTATATREFREFWHDALSRFAGPSPPQALPPGQDWEMLNASYSTDAARWFGVPMEYGG